MFLPLPLGPDAAQERGDENYNIVARLKPGVTVQQAQADVNVIANGIRIKDRRDSSFGMDDVLAGRSRWWKMYAGCCWCCWAQWRWC